MLDRCNLSFRYWRGTFGPLLPHDRQQFEARVAFRNGCHGLGCTAADLANAFACQASMVGNLILAVIAEDGANNDFAVTLQPLLQSGEFAWIDGVDRRAKANRQVRTRPKKRFRRFGVLFQLLDTGLALVFDIGVDQRFGRGPGEIGPPTDPVMSSAFRP